MRCAVSPINAEITIEISPLNVSVYVSSDSQTFLCYSHINHNCKVSPLNASVYVS